MQSYNVARAKDCWRPIGTPLSKSARRVLVDPEELGPGDPADSLARHLSQLAGLRILTIGMHHLYDCYRLRPIHKDPIDRILIGQARPEHLTLISPDREIRKYQVATLW